MRTTPLSLVEQDLTAQRHRFTPSLDPLYNTFHIYRFSRTLCCRRRMTPPRTFSLQISPPLYFPQHLRISSVLLGCITPHDGPPLPSGFGFFFFFFFFCVFFVFFLCFFFFFFLFLAKQAKTPFSEGGEISFLSSPIKLL